MEVVVVRRALDPVVSSVADRISGDVVVDIGRSHSPGGDAAPVVGLEKRVGHLVVVHLDTNQGAHPVFQFRGRASEPAVAGGDPGAVGPVDDVVRDFHELSALHLDRMTGLVRRRTMSDVVDVVPQDTDMLQVSLPPVAPQQ